MPVLNILDQIQTEKAAKRATPISPAYGCHTGIVTGVAMLTIISKGVKGGKSDNQTARELMGFCVTGQTTKSGMIIGRLAGKVTFYASLLSLQADLSAAIIEFPMIR